MTQDEGVLRSLRAILGPVVYHRETHVNWPVVGDIINAWLPYASLRIYPQDSEEAARYWTQGTEAEDEEEEIPEAVINMQARDQEGQEQAKIQERRDQEAAADQPRTRQITGARDKLQEPKCEEEVKGG
jgi:hypothetical protein